MKDIDIPLLPHAARPADGFVCGGQPTLEHLEQAAEAGLKLVVCLRPETEQQEFDEALACKALGLRYVCIAIAGPQDLTLSNVQRFDAALAEGTKVPTLVHCGTGNRVGALIALRAAWIQGRPAPEAIATGRRWGLTSLEPAIVRLLNTP